MTENTTINDKRAQHVAAMGIVLQLASFGILLGISSWAESPAVYTAARFMFAGIPIWIILFLVFKQVRRVGAEQLESAELIRAKESGRTTTIFDVEDEALLLEQNRLRWMIRWMLPSVAVIVAMILLFGHFIAWDWDMEPAFQSVNDGGMARTLHPTMMMWFIVGVGFICFLYARYALALSQLKDWRLLHAGATYMAGNAIICLGLAIALMSTTIEWVEPLMAYATRVLMILLGLEMVTNFVMDFYRPRQSGMLSRPSFDSRILGLTSEPGSIAKSIAETINYQFGFEVSSTWFYQLLQRWLFPIMVVTTLIVFLMSSFVIVDANEAAVVERFGRLTQAEGEYLGPGIHLKWPYPIDKVRRAPVSQIGELVIGEAAEEEEEHSHGYQEAVIWTEAHDYVPEMMLVVAAPKSQDERALELESDPDDDTARSVAVSLLMVSIPIEYRIKSIHQYLYRYEDPIKVMESVAYQYLSDYAAGVDIDNLMGPGRKAFNREIKSLIQHRLDDLEVGIEIVFVGIRDAHPPAKNKVAAAFQGAIASQTDMLATINAARGESRKILTRIAGTVSRSKTLDKAIREKDRLQTQEHVDPEALSRAEARIEDLLLGSEKKRIPPLSGQAAAMIANAHADASRKISETAAKARVFQTELVAYRAAPELYKQRKRLEVFQDIDDIRKYLILGDMSKVEVVYETAREGGLDQVLSEGVENEQKRNPGQ